MTFEEWSNKKKKEQEQSGSVSTSTKPSFSEWSKNKTASAVDSAFIDTFITDANSFLGSAEEDYSKVAWGNASSLYNNRYKQWLDLDSRAISIRNWLDQNKDRLDEGTYNSLSSSIADFRKSVTPVVDAFKSASDYYSQWDTEGAYNTWYEAYKRSEEEKNSVFGAEDFEEYYQKGKVDDDNNDFIWEFFGTPLGESNYIEHYRKYYADAENYGAGTIGDNASFALAMTDDEVKLYDYYLGKYGEKKAKEYLGRIEDTVNQRVGSGLAQVMSQNKFLEATFAVSAGIDQFASGVKNIDNWIKGTEADPTSPVQYANAMIRQDIDGGWGVAYDLLNTMGNMLPSILVSTIPVVGQVAGAASMGVSASGNAYAEMLKLGYDKDQARAYSLLVGVSESTLQYALGGIGKLGGKLSGKTVTTLVNKFDNALARTAIKLGGNMVSEGLEEAVQEVLDPVFKSISTGEDFEGIEWDQVLYSGLLGALSAGVLEGAGTISAEVGTYQAGKAVKEAGGVERLTKLGSSLSADTAAYKIADKVNENTGAYTIGRLYQEVGATISEQNAADIAAALEAKGMSSKTAKKLAKQYQSFLNGEMELNDAQIAVMENLDPLSDVLRKNIIGRNTTVYQRTRAYSDVMIAEDIAADIAASQNNATPLSNEEIARRRALAENGDFEALAREIASQGTSTSSKSQNASERKFSTSDDGKTVLVDTGEEVEIQGIASIENGKVKLRTNKGDVDAEKISFGTDNEALLYEAVTDMTAEAARNMIDSYDPNASVSTSDYIHGFKDSYKYGFFGFAESELAKGVFTKDLSEAQRHIAYTVGKNASEAVIKEAQNKRTEAKEKGDKSAPKNGKIFINGKEYTLGDKTGLGGIRDASVKGAAVLAESLGTNVYFYESYLNKEGKRVYRDENGNVVHAPHGKYDPQTGYIYIDLNAGKMGEGLVMYTVSHELTHFIRDWSPAKFKVFADFLLENYAKKGVSVEALVQEQIEKAAKNGREISFDEAYEEVIADSCQAMLEDGSAIKKIAELKAKDQSLWQKIKKFLSDIVAKIKKAYAGLDPYSAEGRFVKNKLDTFEQLQSMWIDALVDAGETYSAMGDIVQADADGQSVAPMLSERTWTESEYLQARDATAKQIVKDLGVSIDTAYKYIDDINSVARLISDDRARLDYEPNLDSKATVIKPNSDYKWSVDMSTLCAKRLLFTGTFDAIQRALPNTAFDSDDIVRIRGMMEERGYEVACGICYVESTRREIGTITADFIERYKEAQKTGKPITRLNSEGKAVELRKTKDQMQTTSDASTNQFFAENGYTPTLAELNTTDIDLVKRDHPLVYEAYLNYMNARGQAKPKLLETRAEYKGEILKHFKYKSAVTSRNNAGGLRLQSFSDFEVPHLIDMMQITMDMARVGLKSQAYTKVPNFAEAFGNTGIKINLSLIAKGTGVDSKGNLSFDDKEGIDHTEAFRLRDKFSKNVGTILVGKNDAHIIAAMADPRIDYIIPFHKSSWKESLYDALGLTGYDNYETTQHEKPIDSTRTIKDFDPSEYWDFSKSGDENAQIYLEKCRKDGRIPKFPQFQGYEGYWKLLIDFKMYDNDGVGSPQEVVQPIFDNAVNEKILAEYEGGHRSFPVAKDVVDDFVKEKKKDTKLSDRDSDYLDAVSRGDMETAQKMVDEAAKKAGYDSPKLYHGTNRGGFTIFDDTKNDLAQKGFFFTTSADVAKSYFKGSNGTLYTEYVRMENPLVVEGRRREWNALKFDIGDDAKGYEAVQRKDGWWEIHTIEGRVEIERQVRWSTKDAAVQAYKSAPYVHPTKTVLNTTRDIVRYAYNKGAHDGVIIKDTIDMGNINAKRKVSTLYIPFNPAQIKSADPVTYDDNGNVIPLSKRFDSKESDIRYSDRDSEGNALSAEQQEFFKDSRVRWGDKLMPVYHGAIVEFTVFDNTKSYEKTRVGGLLWAAKDYEYAKGYSDSDDPIVKKGYLNITKLLDIGDIDSYTDYDARLQEIADLVKLTTNDLEGMIPYRSKYIYDITSSKGFRDRVVELGYDGVEALESGIQTFGFANSNQFKSVDNKSPTSDPDIRYSDRDFSYSELVAKEDLKGFVIGKAHYARLKADGNIDDDFVFSEAKKGCKTIQTKGKPVFSVDVPDIGRSVEITKNGVTHSFTRPNDRRNGVPTPTALVNARVALKIPDVLKNSIEVNRSQRGNNIDVPYTHVMMGTVALENAQGALEYYAVRSMIQERKNQNPILVEANVLGKLYATNAKKISTPTVQVAQKGVALADGDAYAYSIADFLQDVKGVFDNTFSQDVYQHLGVQRKSDEFSKNLLYSDRDSYAPVFYSHMGKTIDEIKIAKMGAGGVVPYLKGRGVKDEEIKWSGIEAFLEGKKSVTKEELQEFVAGSQLQIVEQMSGEDIDLRYNGSKRAYTLHDSNGEVVDTFTYNEFLGGYVAESDEEIYSNDIELREALLDMYGKASAPKWEQYKLDGGSNYRELVFQMPNSSYSNRAMRGHWGEDAEGVLVHARIQDFDTAEGKMLFVEELQSDWHNEGHEKGYSTEEYEAAVESRDKLYNEYKKLDVAFHKYVRSNEFMTDPEDVRKKKHDWLRGKVDAAYEKYLKAKTVVDSLKQKGMGDVADAPFRDTYHEYVMKRLIRMAAEEGYDIIGWTPSEIQVDRWSEDYAEGYRIEYDQEIPKFLRKYGKKWGATVGKTALELGEYTDEDFERDFRSTWENRWSDYDDVEFDSYYDDDGRFTVRATNRETGEVATSTKGNRTASNEVWSMPITAAMKQSVLHEGQPMYSDRSDSDISNRELLANALESAAANDIERNKLALYKQKISLINAEEQKLHELKAKIGELSFAKGKKDVEQIKKLQFEAKQTENRINTYDRQLLNLEASAPLKAVLDREKKMAYKKAEKRGKDALAAYREKAAADKRKLLERASESRKRGIEGRRMTEMRHKIKSITSELNDLILKPTNKKHIKEELRKSVADALSAINMDTVGAEERVAHYNDLIARAKDPDVIEALTQSRDRIQLQGDNLQGKLTALQNAYEKIKNSEDIQLNLAYQEVILNSIKAVSEKVGNTAIRNMSLEQLEMVYDLYSMIRKTIRDANKLFKQAKFESIMQTAEAVNEEVRKVGGSRYKIPVISATAQKLWWSLLKPLVAFRTIGSDTLTGLYKNLRAGEDTFFGDVSEAQAFIEEQYKKHGFKSWDMKATKQFTAKSGKTFELTLEQMLSLYAYSRREQAHAHIMEGGIVFEDSVIVEKNKLGIPIKYEVTTKDAFNLSEETLIDIVNSLTAEQKAFVNEMQAYLSSTMGAKGNEVSMEMLGVKLFKEEFYLPIKSSQYYLNFSNEEAGEIKLKNPAFSKETVTHANNPIVLHNFTDLWAEHINNMSMYHSFVLALEDFTRVYNYKTKTDASVETMDTKATIESAYAGATKYISNFLKSLNGGVRMETVGMAEKLTSLAKKGSVLGSWSVAIQQPSAIMRAMASINPKYFVAPPKSLNLVKHKQDWEELKKYAPIAGIKEMGRFDVGMGQDTVDWIKSNKTAMNKVEDALSIPPALMDEVTWLSIWNAVKRETLHNNPKLSPTSEQFLKLAGERFTDIVSLTQVYDSVFSRSQMMRNKSWIAKALTAFMAEPTTTLNMLYDAHIQGKRTGVKGYLKTASSTGGAVVASIVLNAALKSIIMAMRDDDEDESYAESYMEHFFGDLKDNMNPLTLIPIAKDIVSIFKGYDVERMDMALISDLKNAIDAFGSDSKTNYEKWSGLVGAISAFFGVPVKNVERDIRGLLNTMFGDSEDTTSAGLLNAIEEGWTGKEKSNGQQLYEAMLNGDDEQIERVKGRFKDQAAIDNAIRKALRENDPRIKEAAQAIIDEDYSKYTDLANEIIGEGYFSETNVVKAIKSEVDAMTEDEEETEETEDKDVSLYEMEHFFSAVVGDDFVMAQAIKEDIIRTKIANGDERDEAEESFNSSFTNKCSKEYKKGNISYSEAVSMLVSYGGKTEEKATSKVQYWDFQMDYPEYDDLSESAVGAYYEHAAPVGIGVSTYSSYYKSKSKCKGTDSNGDGRADSGTVKAEILAVINSLPLTSAQKDALYFAEGWAASKIWEAPWR